MGKNRGQKRDFESTFEGENPCNGVELRAPLELPPREASAVGAALERWGNVRCRVDALRPALEHEDRLMQDILDRGLGTEDRKTLRKLASGTSSEAEEEARQVAASIGGERERLQEILMRSQRELLELSTSATPDYKKELLAEMDAVLDELRRAQDAVHSELLAAKERSDMNAVRVAGRSLNDLKALTRRLDGERRALTKNSALAALLVTVCRRVLPVRHVDPDDLRDISPSYEGYLQILDFYFFSDASLYCFGEHYSGPNWFTRLKRNIAILMVDDAEGKRLYNAFAVSGVHMTPGAPHAPENGPLVSIEAEDEHGRVFDRRHDAEFKLLSGFCLSVGDEEKAASLEATASLWSKKPLCRSCAGAVQQVQRRFPRMKIEIEVGTSVEEGDGCSASSSSTLPCRHFTSGCTDLSGEVITLSALRRGSNSSRAPVGLRARLASPPEAAACSPAPVAGSASSSSQPPPSQPPPQPPQEAQELGTSAAGQQASARELEKVVPPSGELVRPSEEQARPSEEQQRPQEPRPSSSSVEGRPPPQAPPEASEGETRAAELPSVPPANAARQESG